MGSRRENTPATIPGEASSAELIFLPRLADGLHVLGLVDPRQAAVLRTAESL
jgi:hypothetical protein